VCAHSLDHSYLFLPSLILGTQQNRVFATPAAQNVSPKESLRIFCAARKRRCKLLIYMPIFECCYIGHIASPANVAFG
jgi:hypothetical protein